MRQKILVTGSAGVIGYELCASLRAGAAAAEVEVEVAGLDLCAEGEDAGDIRDEARVERAVRGCTGIVHLAAISRVAWGEQDPETCLDTNVRGTRNVVEVALSQAQRPWLVLASSREVYGEPEALPVTEDTPLRPVNVYGRSKAEAEAIVREASARGLPAAVVRLSNVVGSLRDHPGRVVPAFVRAAVLGEPLRVDGPESTFDFVHIGDTVAGILAVVRRLAAGGEAPAPVHLATGVGTTLGELACLVTSLAGTAAVIEEAPARARHVTRFRGDPARARETLGWEARVSLREGLSRVIAGMRAGAP
jgi:nucleoside-diphosphate-sugar epimerase